MTTETEISESKSILFKTRNLLILILLIAAFTRILGLGHRSLWVDEIISAYVAAGSDLKPTNEDLSYIYFQRAQDVTPPLREYLIHYCFQFFGVNEASMRLFPALFGILGIGLIYYAAKMWFDEKIGLISAILLTLSPTYLFHSQNGRMYTVIIFLAFASLYCLHQGLYAPRRNLLYWVGFTLGNTLNGYLSYFGFWALISQLVVALVWIVWDSKKEKKPTKYFWSKMGILVICLSFLINLYIPWINVLIRFIVNHIHSPIPYTGAFTESKLDKNLAEQYMYYLKPSWSFFKDLLTDFGADGIGKYIYFVFAMLGIGYGWKLNKKITVALIVWLIVPLVIAFAPPAKELFFPRYISFIMPGYMLLIALGIYSASEYLGNLEKNTSIHIRPTIYCSAILAVCFALNIVGIVDNYRFDKQNWRDSVQYLNDNIKTGDIVIAGPYNAMWCVLFYSQQNGADHGKVFPSKYGGEGMFVFLHGKTFALSAKVNSVEELQRLCNEFPRVWYISAYYRKYQYRGPDYFDYVEHNFPTVKIFPAREHDDSIFVFLHENPQVKPDPNILWPPNKK